MNQTSQPWEYQGQHYSNSQFDHAGVFPTYAPVFNDSIGAFQRGMPPDSKLFGNATSPYQQHLRKMTSLPTSSHSISNAPSSPADSVSPDQEDDIYFRDDDEGNDSQSTQASQPSRNEKKKMKRFRLTHNQTRFLMSEFAKQAHPDAAHRERLAQEVPGLSPRQVQVWFQNRRAKLKRLNHDDRESMMRSRALPEDFDMTQALHSPYGGSVYTGSPMSSPGQTRASVYSEERIPRSVMPNSVPQGPDIDSAPPSAVASTFGGVTFPSPGSTSTVLSTISTPQLQNSAQNNISGVTAQASQYHHHHHYHSPPQRARSHNQEQTRRAGGAESTGLPGTPSRATFEPPIPGSAISGSAFTCGMDWPNALPAEHVSELGTPYYGPFTTQHYDELAVARSRASMSAYPIGPDNEPLHPPLVLSPEAYTAIHEAFQYGAFTSTLGEPIGATRIETSEDAAAGAMYLSAGSTAASSPGVMIPPESTVMDQARLPPQAYSSYQNQAPAQTAYYGHRPHHNHQRHHRSRQGK